MMSDDDDDDGGGGGGDNGWKEVDWDSLLYIYNYHYSNYLTSLALPFRHPRSKLVPFLHALQ